MITEKQIAALRYVIFKAKNGTELTKRILALLIEKSENMTKEVCVTLVEYREGYTKQEIDDAAHGLGAMKSCNCTTHINEIMHVLGSGFRFSVHYGDFDPTRKKRFCSSGIFSGFPKDVVPMEGLTQEGLPMRYTFWLSKECCSEEATYVATTREELEKFNLGKSGLYEFEG